MEVQVREGIVMRSRTVDEAAEIYGVINANRAYLREWLPWVDGAARVEAIADVIASWNRQEEAGTNFVYGIYEDGRYIGNIGLHDVNHGNRSAMIGYWLAESAQGRGIMTDCVRAMTDFGFTKLDLNRIYIHAAVPNVKSCAIPERLGYVHEGTMQDGECLYGRFFDMALYGVVKRKWKKSFAKNEGDAER